MRGDVETLIREYAVDFCLSRAMDLAGYRGPGRIYEAVRDIEEHAHILKRCLGADADSEKEACRKRILREYERIAFAGEDEGIRTSDKLKALDMYRILSDPEGEAAGAAVVVRYDYGDDKE